jgi:hypothetical protein
VDGPFRGIAFAAVGLRWFVRRKASSPQRSET